MISDGGSRSRGPLSSFLSTLLEVGMNRESANDSFLSRIQCYSCSLRSSCIIDVDKIVGMVIAGDNDKIRK